MIIWMKKQIRNQMKWTNDLPGAQRSIQKRLPCGFWVGDRGANLPGLASSELVGDIWGRKGAGSPWGIAPPGLPLIQTCRFPASGSSRCGFAVPHTIQRPCGDTLGGSMPSTWFPPLVHDAAPPSLHGVREGPFPRFTLLWDAPTPVRPSRPASFSPSDTTLSSVVCSPRPGRPAGGPGSCRSGLPSRNCRWRRRGLPGSWKPW